MEIATWISVAIFDYRVIIRGIIVNIRGVHAVVNITSWHVVYESSKKTHLETLNMGLGVHGRRPHMASRDLHRGDLAQVYGF